MVFGGCNKKNAYDLKNLVDDYSSTEFLDDASAISYQDGRYTFNFGSLSSDVFGSELVKIQTLNYNISTFFAKNMGISKANGSDSVSNSDRNKIKRYLDDTKSSLKAIDVDIKNLDFMTKEETAQQHQAEQKRKNLQIFFDALNEDIYRYFVAISNLSNTYHDIYFNVYFKDNNTNYYQQYVNNQITEDNLPKRYLFNARVEYQIFNTTQIYLIENWSTSFDDDGFGAYSNEVDELLKCTLDTNQGFVYNEQTCLMAVQMYNAVALLNNDYANFASARDELLNNGAIADYDECMLILKNYKSRVEEFNRVIKLLYAQASTI